jgi:hypothetical protein
MLWRYLPVIVPRLVGALEMTAPLLDARSQRAHLLKRNLTEVLPNGRNVRSLSQGLATTDVMHYSMLRPQMYAMRQRDAALLLPRTRLSMHKPDYRVLPDYSVIRDQSVYQSTRYGAMSADRYTIMRDHDVAMQRDASASIQLARGVVGSGLMPMEVQVTYLPSAAPERSRNVILQAMRSASTPLDLLTQLSERARPTSLVRDTRCDHTNPFLMDGSLQPGTFFETPLVSARLEPLPDEDFGFVDLDTRPFQITLNSRMAYPRLQMSFVHEMLHVLMEMHKVDLPHETLHELALLIVNDLMPGLGRLAEYTSQQQP